MKTSLFKKITSFIKSYAKPNSEISSTRILGLMLIPVMVVLFYVALFRGVEFSSNTTTILLTMFCVLVGMAMGSVFLEHAIDRICRAMELIKGGRSDAGADAKE